MEIDENRMRFVQENLGVEHLIDGREDAEAQLRAVFGGDLPEISVSTPPATRAR